MPEQQAQRRIGAAERMRMIRGGGLITEADLGITRPEYPSNEFTGKTLLVTGVSHFGGFGYRTARQLTEMSAGTVAISFRQWTNQVDEILINLRGLAARTGGTRIIGLQADFANLDQTDSLIPRLIEETGRLDVYIANAGSIAQGSLKDQTREDVERDGTINVLSPQLLLGHAVQQMAAQRATDRSFRGRVVGVISVGIDGVMHQSRYVLGKASQWGALTSAALEGVVDRHDVTTIAIAPAFSRTPMTEVVDASAASSLKKMIHQDTDLPAAAVAEWIVLGASSQLPPEFNGHVIPVFRPLESAKERLTRYEQRYFQSFTDARQG